MSNCTVYIDEAGDLGVNRGTRWFVLTAVVVNHADEPDIAYALHLRKNRKNPRRDCHMTSMLVHNPRVDPAMFFHPIQCTPISRKMQLSILANVE